MKLKNVYLSLSLVPITCLSSQLVLSCSSNYSNQEHHLVKESWEHKEYEQLLNSEIVLQNYINKINNSDLFIKVDNQKANIDLTLDSYQQHDRMFKSDINGTFSFKYNKVARVDKNSYSDTNFLNFNHKLNDDENNTWKYEVSKWWAKAKERYIGNVVIVPMYAGEVNINAKEKIYDKNMNGFFKKEIEFINELYKDKIRSNMIDFLKKNSKFSEKFITNTIIPFIDHIFNISIINFEQSSNLKPIISFNSNFLNLKEINFGAIKLKYAIPKKITFKSNNIIPISDVYSKENCKGPKCAHNLRSLVDVIITSISKIALENFGKENWVDSITRELINTILNVAKNEEFSRILFWLLEESDKNLNWINDISKYISNNAKRILLGYFGQVEKRGIQLGKCGNLVASVKINSNNNKYTMENNEPFIIYSGNLKSFFNEELNDFNYNTIYCIEELANYKNLYNYINNNKKLPNDIKKILKKNIKNLSVPSKDIYDMINDYISFKKEPIEYKNKLKTFKKFIEEDNWKVPNILNIQGWDFLKKYILPSVLNDTFNVFDNDKKEEFYSKGLFKKIKNLNIKNKNNIISNVESKEITRFKKYDEIFWKSKQGEQ